MTRNRLIAVIVIILVLIGLTFYFYYWKKTSKSEFSFDPCENFPAVQGEITCQEAEKLVLEKYPGDVRYIEKSVVSIPFGKLPGTGAIQKNAWVIGVLLRDRSIIPSAATSTEKQATSSGQSYNIEVVVDRNEKNILFYTTDCKKCLE